MREWLFRLRLLNFPDETTSIFHSPKGAGQDLINAIVEMKRHNRRFGCHRIAMQILNAFGLEVSKDLVRHILNKHFTGFPSSEGPSRLTFFGEG